MIDKYYPSSKVIRKVRRENQALVLELVGDIDMAGAVQFKGDLLEIVQEQPPLLVLEMSGVVFMDSSGLATLVELLQAVRDYAGELRLVGLQQRVRSILEISHLDKIFKVFDREAEALE